MSNTLDFAPLFRSTIGFDRMLNTLESASRVTSIDTWPPYDIVRKSENDYRISMAVAGLTESDLTITQEQNMLLVAGNRARHDPFEHRRSAGTDSSAQGHRTDQLWDGGDLRLTVNLVTVAIQG